MCSIFCILGIKGDLNKYRTSALEMSRKMRHRGPDWSGVYSDGTAILAHERLAIVDVEGGAQPIVNASKTCALAVNGEIYNHQSIREDLPDYDFQSKSDCEVIMALYETQKQNFIEDLSGMFAFVLYDKDNDRFFAGRDPIGIIPLYYGQDEHGHTIFASEMKALLPVCSAVQEFPPGHIWDSRDVEPKQYYSRDWQDFAKLPSKGETKENLRKALESAVQTHMMSDVPYGVLLSGGLDSSLIAAIAQKYAAKRIEDLSQSVAWWPQLHSFAVGLKGAPDLVAAQKVADHIGTIHHELHFTIQEGVDALSDVIYHLETYDVTTIRAGTPMYLMARKIRAFGIKMVLSGEGADEIFGGYLYFHKAPSAQEFHEETVRKLRQLHMFDCLRANKAMASWGVEARVPFLDKEFLDVAMKVDPEMKRPKQGERIEKHVLRAAFDGLLPEEILWRQKEQFSDGVGYSWIDALRDRAEREVSDHLLEKAKFKYPHNTPETKEAYLYRQFFERHFPGKSAEECVPGGKTVACSTPAAIAWDKAFQEMADPSGRAVSDVHNDSYRKS